jgi:cobalt-zinc-cadmium efflux system membrane fusion protein
MNRIPGSGLWSGAETYLGRRLLIILTVCVAAIALITGALLWPRTNKDPAQPSASAQNAAAFRPDAAQWKALGFAEVRAAPFPEEEQTEGQIATADDVTVQVFPPFSGQVERVFVLAGDHVVKGQPLAAVRASELAQAGADLNASEASLASARAQLAAAEANAARQTALLPQRGASRRDVEQAQNDLAAARAAVQTNGAAANAVRDRLRILGISESEVRTLTRGGGSHAGALAMIRAPVSGVVVQRELGPGQYLNSTANGATTALFTISDLGKVWLVADVREEDANRVALGDTVQVRVVSLPGRTFSAKINFVGSVIDPTTRRLPVHAVLPSFNGLLKPGMFATFTITGASTETSPAIPESAVVYDGADARVWVAQPDHVLALRQVQVGRRHDGLAQVVSGLAPGEQVVTTGALFIDRAAKGQ